MRTLNVFTRVMRLSYRFSHCLEVKMNHSQCLVRERIESEAIHLSDQDDTNVSTKLDNDTVAVSSEA
jgi:hypothetical protein